MAERYKWLDGPYKGVTETLNCETETSIFFNSGRCCEKTEINNKMIQISDSQELGHTMNQQGFMGWDEENNFSGDDYGIDDNDFLSNINVENIDDNGNVQISHTKPKKQNPQEQQITNEKVEKKQPQKQEVKEIKTETKEITPIRNLLNLQKDDSLINKTLDFSINLQYPSDDIIKLLCNTFGEDDVKNELINYLNDQIVVDKLISEIKDSILSKINEIIN